MDEILNDLIKEHTELLKNIEYGDIISKDDPDLLRMEEIMEEIKKLESNESKIS
jgi:hypothetical protein